ncbi:MAG: PAS domain S-box protein [Spirochaetota bacterium]|nr:MAG: PAS domain S-box protein [Spirochaetota bacterium]
MNKANNGNINHSIPEEFFLNVINSLDDPVFVKDTEHRWVFLNDAACKFWGYNKEYLIGKSDYDIFPKEQADIYWEKDEQVLKSEKTDLNEEAQTINGVLHTISTKKSIYKDPETGEKYIVGTIRDITEQKRIEEALRESEEKFRNLAEHSPNMIFIHAKGNIVYVNRKCEEVLGYKRKDFYSPDFEFLALIAPESRNLVKMKFNKHLNGEDLQTYEHTIITKEDTKAEVIINSKLIDYEGEKAILGIVTDITEHKKSEIALAESEKRFRQIAELFPLPISIIDSKGRYEFLNNAFIEVFGYTLEDIPTGQEWFRKAHPDSDYRHEVISIWLSDLEKSGKYEIRERQFMVSCKDGQVRDIVFRPVTIEDNKQFIVYEDLTGRKRAELEKEKIQDQLRQSQRIEAVGRLAGGIAHDFNNLLTAIIGYSDILMEQNLSNNIHHHVEEIKNAADRAASLTQQLLAFSRKQIMKPKILNLNELIKNINQMLKRLITEDIDLVTSLDPELVNIKADPGQIEQVIVNLAVNARDAMPTGGKLLITTKKVYLDNEFCKDHRGSRPGNYIRLEVSDTGRGMDEEIRKHIFEPFFTTKDVGKGTGLGLATVYGVVKQSDGYIWVDSELNQGTTITIYFPQIDKLEKKKKPGYVEKGMKGRGEKILIVEDEDVVRSMTSKALGGLGYSVIEARDGIEALENCEEEDIQSIDLLITDVVMPKMSGRDLTNRLLHRYPKMKVLYISGYTDDVIVHHGVLYKGLPFLQKPYTSSTLSKKVREVLDST